MKNIDSLTHLTHSEIQALAERLHKEWLDSDERRVEHEKLKNLPDECPIEVFEGEEGFGYPSIKDAPAAVDLFLQEKKAVRAFARNQRAKAFTKAVEFVDVQEEIAAVQYSRKRTPYWFVTINPKPEVTLEQLHNRLVDLLSMESIESPKWVYEVRKPGEGLHAHVLFTCHTSDKNFADRKVKSLFVPDLCGNKKHVHVKWVTQAELAACESYMTKANVSKSKKPSNDATLQWRQENNVPSLLNEDHLLVWSELEVSNSSPIIPLN